MNWTPASSISKFFLKIIIHRITGISNLASGLGKAARMKRDKNLAISIPDSFQVIKKFKVR
jgi:hypothetical protein